MIADVNGQQIGETTTDQWSTTVRIPIAGDVASCQSKTVYAIDAQDSAGAAGLIATINHCGEAIRSVIFISSSLNPHSILTSSS